MVPAVAWTERTALPAKHSVRGSVAQALSVLAKAFCRVKHQALLASATCTS